ncbi:MAG: hypothetical protein ACLU4N_07020 [Butyricimonas faecihominis]
MELANRNNPFRYDVVCRMLQARQQVAQAKAGRGFKARRLCFDRVHWK